MSTLLRLLFGLLFATKLQLGEAGKVSLSRLCAANCSLHAETKRKFDDFANPEDYISMADKYFSAFSKDRVKHISDRVYKCGHLYYVGVSKISFDDAVTVCAQRRMWLASISGGERQRQCLVEPKSKTALLSFSWLASDKTSLMWTSGMAEGKPTCRKAAYSWCALPNGLISAEDFGLPEEVSSDRCLAFERETGLLIRQPCDAKLGFYCEHQCINPICPQASVCAKDASLFGADDKLKQGMSLGNWLQMSLKDGNISYLFSHKRTSFVQNMEFCCQLGMKPIVVTDALLNRLRFKSSFGAYSSAKSAFDLAPFYWTAGSRQGCSGHYRFCFHESIGPWDSKEKFWSDLNTAAPGSCLILQQLKNKVQPMHVSQITCTSRLINAACESRNQNVEQLISPQSQNQVQELGCSPQPMCETIFCNPDMRMLTKFSSSPKDSYILARPKTVGAWKKSCGVYHLIPSVKLSWSNAGSFCCGIGMRLVSIYSFEKQICLRDVLSQSDPQMRFWTSGTDRPCPGVFRWCSGIFSDFLKPNLQWRKNRGSASCVALQNDAVEGAVLGTENCNTEFNFICESRPFPDSGDEFSALVNECQAVNRLSPRESKLLKLEEIDSFTYKMKCHMQCVAELSGMVFRGEELILDNVAKYLQGSDFDRMTQINISSIDLKGNDTIEKFGGPLYLLRMLASMSKMEFDRNYIPTVKRELMERIEKCSLKVSTGQKECIFVFEFVRCVTNGLDMLTEAWNNRKTVQKSGSADWTNAFTFPSNVSQKLMDGLLLFTPVLSDQYLSTNCISLIQEQPPTTFSACLDLNGYLDYLANFSGGALYRSGALRLRGKNSQGHCVAVNGSTVFATSEEEFQWLFNLLLNGSKEYLLWDEAFVDPDGVLRWCSHPEHRVPVRLDSGSELVGQLPFYLVSKPGDKANLHAVSLDTGIQLTKPICYFDQSFIDTCLSNPRYQPLWKKFNDIANPEDYVTAVTKDRVKHVSDRFFKCGHYYYFGISQVTFEDAVTVCTQRRMSLASFSGGEKHRKCLLEPKPRIAMLSFGWLQSEKTPLVWTSGMSEGKPTCKEAAYSWCALPNGRIDPERVGLSRAVSADKCLAFEKETGLIKRQPCDAKLSFYCEASL
ncbi:Hypothetical predicted protein [Cloeon dipterum]|uniref:C-type lectin domain-containing protein n=1 Tax=Cloeon dipterum TaxID=197152 RepID=A0A8S1D4J0_9INSE|nr:Hypothetical predicted protein [Cloeon dipterum]